MQAAQRMQRSISWKSVPIMFDRPLSTRITWYSSGPSRSPPSGFPGRRTPVEKVVYTEKSCPVADRASSRSSEVQSSSVGTTFSIEARTMCTRGSVCVRSPLPSFVTITLLPVSAMRKFAPVMPTSAARKRARSFVRASVRMSRRSENTRSFGRSVCISRKLASQSSRLRWKAGPMMCDGGSLRSCRMYSPRSVSTGVIPCASRWSFTPSSSEIMDLPFVTVRAPARWQMASTAARASSDVGHQCTWPPARSTLAAYSSR